MARDKQPVRVRVPGTKLFVLREAEGEGRCTQCKSSRSSLFSYDDAAEPFCNIRHWMTFIVLKFGIGGGRLEGADGKRPRGHRRRYLASTPS